MNKITKNGHFEHDQAQIKIFLKRLKMAAFPYRVKVYSNNHIPVNLMQKPVPDNAAMAT